MESLNVKAYNDESCTLECTQITWGTIAPGGQTSKTVYVKNTGTVSANLNMTTSGLTPPEAAGLIWVEWDSEGEVLTADSVHTATLTLHVDASLTDVTNFSVNIVITGTQA